MAPIILSTAGYILVWLKEHRNYLIYMLSCSFVYLAALTFVRTLDVLLPIFFLVLVLPLLASARRISSATFLLIIYESCYLIYGMLFQDTVASIVAFVSRDWQFLFFFLCYDILLQKPNSFFERWKISRKNIVIAIVVESVLGLYLASTNLARGRSLRLVADAQPITGNIAIIALPLIVSLFYGEIQEEGNNEKNNQTKYIRYILVLFFWTVLSGTRGYVLIYGLTLIPLFYSFFFEAQGLNKRAKSNRVILFAFVSTFIIWIVLFSPTLVDRAMRLLRIGAGVSTGIRKYENAAVLGFWKDASIGIKIFGIGIGGKPGAYPEFLHQLQNQFALGMWDRAHYLNDSGAIFHNLYACILCSRGLLGIVVVFFCYVEMWNRISVCTTQSKGLRLTLHWYMVGFAVMNYYRWSATCGICELVALSCVLVLDKKRIS